MVCEIYKQHELGEIGDKEYRVHLEECAACRETNRQDDFILNQARALKQPVTAPHLWQRIRRDIQGETTKLFSGTFFKLAASFLILVCITGFYFLILNPINPTGLLNESGLRKVEKMEQAYVAAIAELEETVQPVLKSIDVELALCYRDRLETIDEQINRCKKELKHNPANTHIRRYLLAALQDKKQTLIELNPTAWGDKVE